jgi:hypothetical protein
MTRPHSAALCAALLLLSLALPSRGEEGAASPESAVSPADEARADPTWYGQALAHGDGRVTMTHFWSKGPKLRAETVIAGHKVVTIVNGEFYYALDALGGKGIAIRRAPAAIAADSPDRRPFGREWESLVRQGAERIREEEIQGAPTELYRLTDLRGRREIWVSLSEPRLPVRMSIFTRSTGKTQTTDYINWLRNLTIDDFFFEPDPGVDIKRFEFEEFLERSAEWGPVGPIPVLFYDLLHGNVKQPE